MRDDLMLLFILYPFVVNFVSIVAGLALFLVLTGLRRKRHGKATR